MGWAVEIEVDGRVDREYVIINRSDLDGLQKKELL